MPLSRITGLFRKSALADVQNPETRPQVIAAALDQASRQMADDPDHPENWQKPLQELADALVEVGEDPIVFLRAAANKLVNDPHWRREFLKRALPLAHVAKEDLPILLREAESQPRVIGNWIRLFEEAGHYRDPDFLAEAQETFVLRLAAFFPPSGENSWFDIETEAQARSMFFNRLDDCTDRIVGSERDDERALQVLQIAQSHFPNRGDVTVCLAHFHRRRGAVAAESLGLILQALLFAPDDVVLKRAAARFLSERAGHEQEGLDLVLQAYEAAPNDPGILADVTQCIARVGKPTPAHVEILRRRFREAPNDPTVVSLLSQAYADTSDKSDDVVEVAQLAAEANPSSSDAVLRVARLRMDREEWREAATALEALPDPAANPDVAAALGYCWARLDLADEAALKVYAQVVARGDAPEELENAWCKHLYRTAPDAPESIQHFRETARRFPRALWPTLGLVRHMIGFNDIDRAQENLGPFIVGALVHKETIELAARILAADPRRQRVRQYLILSPDVAVRIFARAVELAPESLLLMMNLARYRLKNNLRNRETADLLADICRRDTADVEMRLARADILYDLGDHANALGLYCELLTRFRETTSSAGTTSGFVMMPDQHERVQTRACDLLMASAEPPSDEDARVLLETALDPDASPAFVSRAAQWIVEKHPTHPLVQGVIERAIALDPENENLEMALADAKARRGNPRPALHLVLRRLEQLHFDRNTLDLLETVVDRLSAEHVNEEVRHTIIHLSERRKFLPDRLVILLARLFIASDADDPRFIPVLQRASKIAEAPDEVTEALVRCRQVRSEFGQHDEDSE